MVALRYTGVHPVSFTDHGIGVVGPGGEFRVPAWDAERFTRRPDVDLAGGKLKLKATPAADARPESEADAAG